MGDAFWLVASPENRALAEEKWRAKATDPNSALFKSGMDEIGSSDVLARQWTFTIRIGRRSTGLASNSAKILIERFVKKAL
ncbi:hypothetical protein [Caulobacter sp.]|uniref:hypothetical protein n=1 Tax=Caulobacter sp. TaxID=78 RepID=UPI003BAB266E